MTGVLAPAPTAERWRTVQVEHCMGTAFTVELRGGGTTDDAQNAVREVVAWLRHVDAVFSSYRPDSDLNRINRRELRAADADRDVLPVLELCAQARADTAGYFSATVDGRLDPTGLVKGWAVERAGELLRRRGWTNHAINGGGDVQLAGEPAPGCPWTVGITDPHNRDRVLDVIAGRTLAVATSGTGERGAHIVDPFTGRPATSVAGASVAGPSLTRADAYATAACASGPAALRWIEKLDGYELLLVGADGRLQASSGWHRRRHVDGDNSAGQATVALDG